MIEKAIKQWQDHIVSKKNLEIETDKRIADAIDRILLLSIRRFWLSIFVAVKWKSHFLIRKNVNNKNKLEEEDKHDDLMIKLTDKEQEVDILKQKAIQMLQ